MSTPIAGNPLTETFLFHNISDPLPYRAIIYIPGLAGAGTPLTPSGLSGVVVGSLDSDNPLFRIRANVNAGRYGLPALEIGIQLEPEGNQPQARATITYEPGVLERSDPSKPNIPRYQLDKLTAEWLGQPGGSGNHYVNDPYAIGQATVADRKGILRVAFTAYSCTVQPTTFSINDLLRRTSTNHNLRTLLLRLLTPAGVPLKVYIHPGEKHKRGYQNKVVVPFMKALQLRVPPMHQYTNPSGVLHFNMPLTNVIRNHIYCNKNGNSFTAPMYLLPDTQSREHPGPVAMVQKVGVIRENQACEGFCRKLCGTTQSLRLVRSPHRVLQMPGRMFGHYGDHPAPTSPMPADTTAYVGYVALAGNLSEGNMRCPRPGTIFQVTWVNAATQSDLPQSQAYGMVLRLPKGVVAAASSCFVMALCMIPDNIKQRANNSVNNARVDPVRLICIQNRSSAQSQLNAMTAFAGVSAQSAMASLRKNALFNHLDHIPDHRDLRRITTNWDNALTDFRYSAMYSNPSSGSLPSRAELVLLENIPRRLDGHLQLIRSSPHSFSFRSILSLVLTFVADDQKVIIVAEDSQDQVKIAHDIFDMLSQMGGAHFCGHKWRQTHVLAYNTTEVEKVATEHATIGLRCRLDLSFKFLLDDFPQHEWLVEESDRFFGTQSNICPANGIALDYSMGDAIQRQLRIAARAQSRQHYYRGRQQCVDNSSQMSDGVASTYLTRRHDLVKEVLKETHILVCSYDTASSEDVKHAFSAPVLILTGTEQISFPKATAVLVNFLNHRAAFICGSGSLAPLSNLASRPFQNEAWTTFSRSAWSICRNAGTGFHNLG